MVCETNSAPILINPIEEVFSPVALFTLINISHNPNTEEPLNKSAGMRNNVTKTSEEKEVGS